MMSDLAEPYALTEQQIRQYQQDGHVFLKNVASRDEVNAVRSGIVDVVDEVEKTGDKQGRISDYSRMFTQTTNVWRRNPAIKDFIFAKRFAKIAADLMGVKAVRLYHDQALIKEPEGKPTPWHQDFYYWPLETEHAITMWMPMVDVTTEMGSMNFVTGSHANKAFPQLPISEKSQAYFEEVIKDLKSDIRCYSLKAGDATFHAGGALHSAHANTSLMRREVITIIYYEDGTRVMEPDNQHRNVDLEVFLPGQRPGEIAASELNPVLYER